MSQALELLNSLTDEEIAQLAGLGSEEAHIVVGRDRIVTVPPGLRRIAVQGDHNIETVTFDCPRFWDNRDLSKMAVYINYMLSNGYKDRYPVDNLRADGELIHFDWTISKNVTPVAGRVSFLVCAVETGESVDEFGYPVEAAEIRHWNSELNQDMFVSGGLECEESELIVYPDLVSQLLQRMNVVEQINVQAEEMERIFANTQAAQIAAESARDVALDESNYIKNSYANAIKGKVTGALVQVHDVSPIEHNPKVRIHGKNLLNIPDTVVEGDYAWCNTEVGSYKLEPGTYTISVDFLQQGSDMSKVSISPRKYEAVTVQYASVSSTELSGKLKATFTIPEGENGFTLYLYSNITADVLNTSCSFSNFQIEIGASATDYEPYIDTTSVKLIRCGKSIFSKPSQVVSGVSKPWTSSLVAAVKAPPGNYVVSCRFNQIGQDKSTVGVSARSYNDYTVPFGDDSSSDQSGYLEKAFTVAEGSGGFQIFLYSNKPNKPLTTECSFENICVEVGSKATGYSVYHGSAYTPNADGFVDSITSLSPDMTLYTDTEGVVVECEYNRDTGSYIKQTMISTLEAIENGSY